MKMRTAKKRKRTTKRMKSRKDEIMTAQETKEGERLKIKNRPCQQREITRKKTRAKREQKQGRLKKDMKSDEDKKQYLDDVLTAVHVKETAHHHGQPRGIHFLHVDL